MNKIILTFLLVVFGMTTLFVEASYAEDKTPAQAVRGMKMSIQKLRSYIGVDATRAILVNEANDLKGKKKKPKPDPETAPEPTCPDRDYDCKCPEGSISFCTRSADECDNYCDHDPANDPTSDDIIFEAI